MLKRKVLIPRSYLNQFFHDTKGKIFTAFFVKKDGTTRMMNCRKGVHFNLKGGENKAAKNNPNLSIVFDMKAREYRMINLETVLEVRFAHESYLIVD